MNQQTLRRDWMTEYADTREELTALRDRFAMAALTGILSDPETKIGQPVAEYAYKMADLMLAEREKQ